MPWGDDAQRFLERVVPASDEGAGYLNVHWVAPNLKPKYPNAPKTFMNGLPFKSAARARNYIYSKLWNNPDRARDIYFCTSLQAQTKPSNNGKYQVAHRAVDNFLTSKLLFLDLDVKADGYTDQKQALAHLADFCTHYGLPMPTALVGSGSGGVHSYWISNRALTLDEWRPRANKLAAAAREFGLHADTQCTVDPVRLLRPPQTNNFKDVANPKPTNLIKLAPADLDFATEVDPALDKIVVQQAVQAASPTTTQLPAAFIGAKPAAVFAGVEIESGAAGIEAERPPLNVAAIVKGCPWLKETLRTGGAQNDNGMWMYSVDVATFFKNGRDWAHAFSSGWAKAGVAYDPAETDAMFDRKVREHETSDRGWVSCAAVERAGCKDCATCPLQGQINSPFDIGKSQPANLPALVTFSGENLLSDDSKWWTKFMPPGYALNETGVPCIIVRVKQKDADGNINYDDELQPLLDDQRIIKPYLQDKPVMALNFFVDGNMGAERHVLVEREMLHSPAESLRKMMAQGVAPNPDTMNHLGKFLMTLSRLMEKTKLSIVAKPLGWVEQKGGISAFAYGGKTFTKDGRELPAGFLMPAMQDSFEPRGSRDPWLKAAQFIIDQDRQDFVVMVMLAFGAPLMQFTNETLGLVALWGKSGKGKSTALEIGQAVWGHPKNAPIRTNASENSVMQKMGTLSNLPLLFDEVRDKALDILHEILMLGGQNRGRLISNVLGVTMAPTMTWRTMLGLTSNFSFLEFEANKTKDNAAGRYRIFEIAALDKISPFDKYHVMELMQPLEFNFGRIGEEYAQFLASKLDELPKLVKTIGKEFDAIVKGTQEERFWSMTCACVLLGAQFARDLGYMAVDLDKLKKFLVEQFLIQRGKLTEDGQETDQPAIELISSFIKEHSRHLLITDDAPNGPGRRSHPINVLKGPMVQNFMGIYVQFIDRGENSLCRISRSQLTDWMEKKQRQISVIYARIPHKVTEKIKLGAGTQFVSAQERVIDIMCPPGHWLYEVMVYQRGVTEADLTQAAARPLPEISTTGATTGEQAVLADAAIARGKDHGAEKNTT